VTAALCLGVLAFAPTAEAADQVTTRQVSFTVRNVNRSAVSCPADGKSYEIRGLIAGPSSALLPGATSGAITVYLHGFGLGQDVWAFDAVAGYDFVRELAAQGQVSLAVDRLGYGASGHPFGTDSCLGSQADVAHQLDQDVRSGRYRVLDRTSPVKFSRVALFGFSAAGAIAQVEAYSFGDIDALGVLSHADQDFADPLLTNLNAQLGVCSNGGQPSDGAGSPGGYAYFGQTGDDFVAAVFHDADPAVEDAAVRLRHRDPCGDVESFPQTIGTDRSRLGEVDVPVLLVYGADDALFQPQAGADQSRLFTGSEDLTLLTLSDTGHILPLERSAPQLRAAVGDWLKRRGL
jgi:pimeloyl-ACP methyl ester carboxylesterase